MAEPRRVDVEILGQRYAIRSDAPPDYVRQLVSYVERRVKEIRGDAPGQDPTKILVLTALDIEPVIVPMEADTKFQPNIEALEQIQREMGEHLDGLIVASPSNPVGAVVPDASLRKIAAYCRQHGIRFVSDEIYHGITYGAPATTAAAIDDQAIVVNSFSKYFSMTGWRLGWLVVPTDLLQPIERRVNQWRR